MAEMRARLAKLVEPLTGPEMWEEVKQQSEDKLIVIDIHKEWLVMDPVFKSIFLDLDEADSRIRFIDAVPDQYEELQKAVGEEASCKPFFMLMRNSASVTTVVGADAPAMQKIVMDNV
eukprot:g5684.t1